MNDSFFLKQFRGLYGSGIFILVMGAIWLPALILCSLLGLACGHFAETVKTFTDLFNQVWDAIDYYIKTGSKEKITNM